MPDYDQDYGKDFQITLSTGVWRFTLEFFRGITCWDQHQIVIAPSKHDLDRLVTIIHETYHAICPKASEAETDRISTDIGRVLWRARYRFTPTKKE